MYKLTGYGNIKESSFSGSNRPEFDDSDIGSKTFKGKNAAREFQSFLNDIKKNKRDWSFKVKGDIVLISYEDDTMQQEEYHVFEIKVIKDVVSGG